jgi:hypothetical protein
MIQLLLTASQGDLCDLTNYWPSSSHILWSRMPKEEFELWLAKKSHCSALVKPLPNNSDLVFGHATWQSYSFAFRIYKTFTLAYRGVAARGIQFSSYPGTFVSTDDFHVLDTGLAVMETSLNVFNLSIYDGNVVPQTLLSWIRAMVANRMATDGASWVATFERFNSGTYNNQWVIVDLNRFVPFVGALSGTVIIAEQMPGKVVSGDVTVHLMTQGYWPSYNVPFFTEIFDYAGYPSAVQQQGPQMLSYDNCVRAEIFRQRHDQVVSVDDLKFILQYNDYQKDPISQGNPLYSIASRVDLTPSSIGRRVAFGAIDAKVSSWGMFHLGQLVEAWSGPTPQQPLFSFSECEENNVTLLGPHDGVPNEFNFGFRIFHL